MVSTFSKRNIGPESDQYQFSCKVVYADVKNVTFGGTVSSPWMTLKVLEIRSAGTVGPFQPFQPVTALIEGERLIVTCTARSETEPEFFFGGQNNKISTLFCSCTSDCETGCTVDNEEFKFNDIVESGENMYTAALELKALLPYDAARATYCRVCSIYICYNYGRITTPHNLHFEYYNLYRIADKEITSDCSIS